MKSKIQEHKPILYRPDIDGLRTIAVGMVILFHIWPNLLTGGFVGVDVFFVISGFLITSIINRELKAGEFSFGKFYSRRMKRILPVFFVVVYVASIAAFFMFLPEDYQRFTNSATNAGLYFSNVYFLGQNNYFTLGAREFPLLHTWSLSVEEQYYVFWPLILFLLGHRFVKKFVWLPTVAVGGLFISSYLFAVFCITHNSSLGYYSIFSRAFELMVGSIVALICASDRNWFVPAHHRHIISVIASVGLGLIILSAVYLTEKSSFPGWLAIFPTLGAGLIIYAGHVRRSNYVSRLLSLKPFVAIGLISYSLYLWHWPILAFWHYYYPDKIIGVKTGILFLALTFLLSFLSYRFIELQFKRKQYNFKQSLIYLHLLLLVPLIAMSTIAVKTHGLPSRMGHKLYLETKFVDAKYCHGQISGTCTTGASSADLSKPRVLLFGDSHGGSLSPFWDQIAQHYGFAIKYYTNGGCYPLLDSHNDLPSSETKLFLPVGEAWGSGACSQQIKYVTQHINDFEVFIIIARWDGYFNNHSISFSFESEFAETLAFLRSHGKHVVVMGDVPGYSNAQISTWLRQSVLVHDLGQQQFYPDNNRVYNNKVEEVVKKYSDIYYFDSDKLLVDVNHNYPYLNGFMLYKDDDHLNQYGSQLLAQ